MLYRNMSIYCNTLGAIYRYSKIQYCPSSSTECSPDLCRSGLTHKTTVNFDVNTVFTTSEFNNTQNKSCKRFTAPCMVENRQTSCPATPLGGALSHSLHQATFIFLKIVNMDALISNHSMMSSSICVATLL